MTEFSAIASNVSSSNFNLLRAVLDDWCDSNGVTLSHDAATEKATALIDWFTELKASWNDPSKPTAGDSK